MKKIKMMFFALMCVVAVSSCSAQRLFSEAADIKGVTSVVVTKPMLKMAGASIGKQEGVDVGKLIEKLDFIEVVSAPANKKVKVKEICNKALKDLNAETLVEVKENDQDVRILAIINENNPELYKGLLIIADEADELALVYMLGNFTMDDLTAAIGATTGSDQSQE